MQAFRNIAGNVVEVQIDVDPTGQPILPPDTTIDPKPVPNPGHYVTVVGNAWVQIPITVEFISFETKKQNALAALSAYKSWYVEQPITYSGVVFDADAKARINLTQALTINTANGYVPPAWIASNNTPFPLADITALKALVIAVQTAYVTKFYEMDTIRQQILAAANETALAAIIIPSRPVNMFF